MEVAPFTLMLISNLQGWIDDGYLESLVKHVCEIHWVLRESETNAYVSTKSEVDARQLKMVLDNHVISNVSSSTQLQVKFAPKFLRSRFALMSRLCQQQQKSSIYVFAVSSVKLSMNDWWMIFPNAFDVYSAVDQAKCYVQFCTVEQAKTAVQEVNGRISLIDMNDTLVKLVTACDFTDYETVMQKMKVNNNVLNNKEKDEMIKRVVDWLNL